MDFSSYATFARAAIFEGVSRLEVFDAKQPATPEIAEFGYELYHDECSFCHGRNGRARTGGSVPDLRYATKETHMQWNGIVIGGARAANGMPATDIDPREAEAIRMYVLSRAYELREQQQ